MAKSLEIFEKIQMHFPCGGPKNEIAPGSQKLLTHL